jgi:hypothetical protein
MATDAKSSLNETWDQIDRQFRFLIDRVLAQNDPEHPELSLVMTCPEYPDSPIIAAMQGFENVCGRPVQSIIGSNCRFLNRGMQNDPETLNELREIQSSPQAARQYMKAYPSGKQFLLRNARPSRMLPEGITMNFEDPDPSRLIYFYNCLTIFAIEIKQEGRKTVVFIGLQCILHNGMDMEAAKTYTNHIQEALTHPHRGVRHIFYQWCRAALGLYHELYKWSQGASGSGSPISQLGSGGSGQIGQIDASEVSPTLASCAAAYLSEFPFSPGVRGSSERSASRESPKNGWVVSSGATTTTAAGSGSQTLGTSSQALGTSSGGGRTSNGSSCDGSEAADGAMEKSQDVAAAEPGSIEHAKVLLDRVRQYERIAMKWYEDNEQEERDSRVQDLLGLREALCDDFAADLELYVAYHSMRHDTLQFEESESH